MSPKSLALNIVKRHPELKSFNSKQLRIVKQALEETIVLSSRDLMTADETDAFFKKRVPDSGTPAAALRAYRNRADLTQRDLAKKADVPQPHIAAIESGKRSIGLIIAKKLALALGVNYRKLI